MSSLNLPEALAIGTSAGWMIVAVCNYYLGSKDRSQVDTALWFGSSLVAMPTTLFIAIALLRNDLFGGIVTGSFALAYLPVLTILALLGLASSLCRHRLGEALGWAALTSAMVTTWCEVAARTMIFGPYQLLQQLAEVLCIAAAVGFVVYIGPLWGMKGMSLTANKQ